MQFRPSSPDQPYIVLGVVDGQPSLLFVNQQTREQAEALAVAWLAKAKVYRSDEARIIRTFGIALLEAAFKRRNLTIPPELFSILDEWIALPEVQTDETVRELIASINAEGERSVTRPHHTPNRAERRKFK